MATAFLVMHGLVAVALLGAITHQTLSTWAPVRARLRSFFGRSGRVRPASSFSCFAYGAVVLMSASAASAAVALVYV